MPTRKLNVKKMIFRIGLIVLIIAAIVFAVISFIPKSSQSINEGARKYKSGTCTVFYPDNRELEKYAKSICEKNIDETEYDYALIPYGDYYLVTYSDGTKYFMDKENNPLVIDKLTNECKAVVSDYLRYDMQKEELDEYYTLDFYDKTYYKNLDISEAEVSLNGTDVSVYLKEFDRTITFPVFYIQEYLGLNLGSNNTTYVKPHYISKDRKTCIFTFNDGPSIQNSSRLIDTLYEYGANATFFIQGNKVNQESVDMMKDSIMKGNEYGSHTENGKILTELSDEEVYYEIMAPADVLAVGYKDDQYDIKGINYNMKYYRATYDIRDERIDRISPLISIRWDIDSYDWLYRDGDHLYNYLMELESYDALDRQIVIMHDYYPETVDAVNEVIKELAGKGYQFVNISEYLDLVGFDFNKEAF